MSKYDLQHSLMHFEIKYISLFFIKLDKRKNTMREYLILIIHYNISQFSRKETSSDNYQSEREKKFQNLYGKEIAFK